MGYSDSTLDDQEYKVFRTQLDKARKKLFGYSGLMLFVCAGLLFIDHYTDVDLFLYGAIGLFFPFVEYLYRSFRNWKIYDLVETDNGLDLYVFNLLGKHKKRGGKLGKLNRIKRSYWQSSILLPLKDETFYLDKSIQHKALQLLEAEKEKDYIE